MLNYPMFIKCKYPDKSFEFLPLFFKGQVLKLIIINYHNIHIFSFQSYLLFCFIITTIRILVMSVFFPSKLKQKYECIEWKSNISKFKTYLHLLMVIQSIVSIISRFNSNPAFMHYSSLIHKHSIDSFIIVFTSFWSLPLQIIYFQDHFKGL